MNKITVIELPESFEDLTLRAVKEIEQADKVILQTCRIGSAEEIKRRNPHTASMDDLFEEAENYEALYESGANRICEGSADEKIAFCIVGDMGSNGFLRKLKERQIEISSMSEHSVGRAVALSRNFFSFGDYEVLEARSLFEQHFDTQKAVFIVGIDNKNTAQEVFAAISDRYPRKTRGVLFAGGECGSVEIEELLNLSSLKNGGILALPPLSLTQKDRFGFYDLVRVMKRLRGENGCPWDIEQTHRSLRPYLIEEAYETAQAIDDGDMNALCDELGDVLLQVVFHAEIGRRCGEFEIDDVCTDECAKMIRRHPHIFGSEKADTSEEVLKKWDQIKQKEKQIESFADTLRDIPLSMGSVVRAYKLQKKASAIGFDWDNPADALKKIKEEFNELKEAVNNNDRGACAEESGDLLFAVINVVRLLKEDPELCLAKTCEKFIDRMAYIERNAKRPLSDLSLEEMDALWEKAKGKRQKNA